jgi:hypothetical protein
MQYCGTRAFTSALMLAKGDLKDSTEFALADLSGGSIRESGFAGVSNAGPPSKAGRWKALGGTGQPAFSALRRLVYKSLYLSAYVQAAGTRKFEQEDNAQGFVVHGEGLHRSWCPYASPPTKLVLHFLQRYSRTQRPGSNETSDGPGDTPCDRTCSTQAFPAK